MHFTVDTIFWFKGEPNFLTNIESGDWRGNILDMLFHFFKRSNCMLCKNEVIYESYVNLCYLPLPLINIGIKSNTSSIHSAEGTEITSEEDFYGADFFR